MTVCIVGVGNMGGGIARNLLSRGYQLVLVDCDPSKLTFFPENTAVSHINTAQHAPVCIATIICVVDSSQTEDVLFGPQGMAKTMSRGHTVLLCPTIAPHDVVSFANRLQALGIHCIDAPMSGGPARAADGTMSLMVACPDAVFTQHAKLIHDLSSQVFRISQLVGDGAKTKLVNNLLAAINLTGAAQTMAMAQRMGLHLPTVLSVIEQSSGQSWIASDRLHRALAGDHVPRAHMGLLAKDTALALVAARDCGYDVPMGVLAHAAFAKALADGLGGHDDAALFTQMRDQSVPKSPDPLP